MMIIFFITDLLCWNNPLFRKILLKATENKCYFNNKKSSKKNIVLHDR